MLAEYVTEVQNLLNDTAGQLYPLPTLHRYINRSRRRIAMMSGCLRVLPPGTQTVPGQEVYRLADYLSLVQGVMPGIESILAVRSLAIAVGRGGWKPLWRQLPWSDFQGRFRIYNSTFLGTISEPGWWAQYNFGTAASIYLAPIPSIVSPMELDLSCMPQPLLTDDDPEPIPLPWSDAVCYWAAVLALLQQQRREDAQAMSVLFNNDMPLCASVVCPQFLATSYGATIRSA